MIIEGVEVKVMGLDDFTTEEAKKYINYVRNNVSPYEWDNATKILIEVKRCDDGKIDLDYTLQGEKFERIRRITGYLTGSLYTWNNAKRSEERERVKHGIRDFE